MPVDAGCPRLARRRLPAPRRTRGHSQHPAQSRTCVPAALCSEACLGTAGSAPTAAAVSVGRATYRARPFGAPDQPQLFQQLRDASAEGDGVVSADPCALFLQRTLLHSALLCRTQPLLGRCPRTSPAQAPHETQQLANTTVRRRYALSPSRDHDQLASERSIPSKAEEFTVKLFRRRMPRNGTLPAAARWELARATCLVSTRRPGRTALGQRAPPARHCAVTGGSGPSLAASAYQRPTGWPKFDGCMHENNWE